MPRKSHISIQIRPQARAWERVTLRHMSEAHIVDFDQFADADLVLDRTGSGGRIVLVQMTPQRSRGVNSLPHQDVYQVSADEYHHWVAVFPDLFVGIGIRVGGRDQDTELAVP